MPNNKPTVVDKRSSATDATEGQSSNPGSDDSPTISNYRCPYCKYTDDSERWVRTHITNSTDSRHKGRHGFTPEVEVEALDPQGNVVETPAGQPGKAEDVGEVTTSLLPEDIDDDAEIIIRTAVENPTASIADLHRRLEEKLDEDITYNRVHYVINNFMSKPPTSSHPKTAENSEQKTFHNLTGKQKSAIVELVRQDRNDLDRNQSQIADDAGVDSSYLPSIIKDYGHVKSELQNWDTLPNQKVIQTAHDVLTREDAAELAEFAIREEDEDSEATQYGDLDDTTQQIVDAIARYPHADPDDIKHRLDYDTAKVEEIQNQFNDVIERRERFFLLEPIFNGLADEQLIQSFGALTDKQQSTAVELAKESNPANPSSHSKIATYAGVHPTYLNSPPSKVIRIANQLRSANLPTQESRGSTTPDDSQQPDAPEKTLIETSQTATSETTKSESDSTPEPPMDATEHVPDAAQPDQLDVPPTTDESSHEESHKSAPEPSTTAVIADLKSIRDTAESLERVAEMQLDAAGSSHEQSQGSKAVATELRRRLDEVIEKHSDESKSE